MFTDRFGEKLFYYDDGVNPTPSEFYYNGNILAQKTAISGQGLPLHRRNDYDDLDRLEGVSVFEALEEVFVLEESFAYDNNGNRESYIRDTGLVVPESLFYNYLPGTNLLDSIQGKYHGNYQGGFNHDANGNLSYNQKKGLTFKYDIYDQMDKAIFNHSTIPDDTVRFGYSPSGERVFKHFRHFWEDDCPPDTNPPPEELMSPGDGGVVAPETFEIADSGGASAASSGPGGGTCLYHSSSATYYIRSQGKVLAEYTTLYTNTPSYRYIYAGDQRIAMRTAPGTLYFYLNDHLGSVAVVVDSVAAVKDFIKYRAYGQTYAAQSVTGQDFSFTGHPLDEEADMDLHYASARYYDAILGRFCAVDPRAGDYPEWSPYTYGLCNPMKYIDPDGQMLIPSPAHDQKIKQLNAESPILGFLYEVFSDPSSAIPEPVAIVGPSKSLLRQAVKQVSETATDAAKTYQTYTKAHPTSGQVKSGRTSGTGAPKDNVAARDSKYPKDDQFGKAKLDKSSSNPDAIRGREQQLIDKHGRAQSEGGTSGNKIRGVSSRNPYAQRYSDAAKKEFKLPNED